MIVAHIPDIAAGILVFIGAWFDIRPQTALGAPNLAAAQLASIIATAAIGGAVRQPTSAELLQWFS